MIFYYTNAKDGELNTVIVAVHEFPLNLNAMAPFFRTYPLLYHNFGNMVILSCSVYKGRWFRCPEATTWWRKWATTWLRTWSNTWHTCNNHKMARLTAFQMPGGNHTVAHLSNRLVAQARAKLKIVSFYFYLIWRIRKT